MGLTSKKVSNQTFGVRVVLALTVLLNAYAGGCVVAEKGPIESLWFLAGNPSDIVSFIMNGLGFYLGAILMLAIVVFLVWMVKKKRPGVESFIIWSTAINFLLVGLAGFGGT